MGTRQKDSQERGLSAWIQDHVVTSLTVAGLSITGIAFGFQVWHGQVEQSTALYESYENSDTINFIDRIAYKLDEIERTKPKPKHMYYIPMFSKIMDDDRDKISFHLSRFAKIMHVLEQCFNNELPLIGVHFMTGCSKNTIIMLLREHILDSFFSVRTYIYCDTVISDYFTSHLAEIERLIAELLHHEDLFSKQSVFFSHWDRNFSIDKKCIKKSDRFAVVRISPARCNMYYGKMLFSRPHPFGFMWDKPTTPSPLAPGGSGTHYCYSIVGP